MALGSDPAFGRDLFFSKLFLPRDRTYLRRRL